MPVESGKSKTDVSKGSYIANMALYSDLSTSSYPNWKILLNLQAPRTLQHYLFLPSLGWRKHQHLVKSFSWALKNNPPSLSFVQSCAAPAWHHSYAASAVGRQNPGQESPWHLPVIPLNKWNRAVNVLQLCLRLVPAFRKGDGSPTDPQAVLKKWCLEGKFREKTPHLLNKTLFQTQQKLTPRENLKTGRSLSMQIYSRKTMTLILTTGLEVHFSALGHLVITLSNPQAAPFYNKSTNVRLWNAVVNQDMEKNGIEHPLLDGELPCRMPCWLPHFDSFNHVHDNIKLRSDQRSQVILGNLYCLPLICSLRKVRNTGMTARAMLP